MKKQLEGLAVILLSLLLTVGFNSVGWDHVFDLDIQWQHIFMISGAVGAAMVFRPEKRKR